MGAYKNRATAEALASQLSDKYSQLALVAPSERPEGTFYRVRVLVATRAEADALGADLRRKQKLKPWIVPIP